MAWTRRGGTPHLRKAAAKWGWPIESKACDQSRKRMYKEVECLSKISVRRRKRKKGVERERLILAKTILVWMEILVNRVREALLDHSGINFVDRVGKWDGSITWRRAAALIIAFVDHDNFADFPVIWGMAQKETVIVVGKQNFLYWMRKEVEEWSVKLRMWGREGVLSGLWKRSMMPDLITEVLCQQGGLFWAEWGSTIRSKYTLGRRLVFGADFFDGLPVVWWELILNPNLFIVTRGVFDSGTKRFANLRIYIGELCYNWVVRWLQPVTSVIIRKQKMQKKNANPNYKKNTTLRGAKSATKGKYNIHWWIRGFFLRPHV